MSTIKTNKYDKLRTTQLRAARRFGAPFQKTLFKITEIQAQEVWRIFINKKGNGPIVEWTTRPIKSFSSSKNKIKLIVGLDYPNFWKPQDFQMSSGAPACVDFGQSKKNRNCKKPMLLKQEMDGILCQGANDRYGWRDNFRKFGKLKQDGEDVYQVVVDVAE